MKKLYGKPISFLLIPNSAFLVLVFQNQIDFIQEFLSTSHEKTTKSEIDWILFCQQDPPIYAKGQPFRKNDENIPYTEDRKRGRSSLFSIDFLPNKQLGSSVAPVHFGKRTLLFWKRNVQLFIYGGVMKKSKQYCFNIHADNDSGHLQVTVWSKPKNK